MIKAVLFDADGVVQSTNFDWSDRLSQMLAVRSPMPERPVAPVAVDLPGSADEAKVDATEAETAPDPHPAGADVERDVENNGDEPAAPGVAVAAQSPSDTASDFGTAGPADEAARFVAEYFACEAPCLRGDADFADQLRALLRRWRVVLPLTQAMATSFDISPHRDVLDVVRRIASLGPTVALASNQQSYRAQHMSVALGYGDVFDYAFFSHALGHTKLEPEFFEGVLTRLNLRPEEVLMVDDKQNVLDVAARVGLQTLQFDNAVGTAEELFDEISERVRVPTLTEVVTPEAVVLQLRNLTKRYGTLTALNGLNLSVKEGQIYGFLGRNGAGKSTAMRIIMGITQATSGEVELLGQALRGDAPALRQQIGYVAQEQHFYGWMTALALGRFVSGFYPNWDDKVFRSRLEQLQVPVDRKVATFSGGMVAKLAFALALAHKPKLLVLDEPTVGMDAVARREFIEIVQEQAQRDGRTTMFSSHLIDEVEAAADTVGVVNAGSLVYEGPLDRLRQSVRGYEVRGSGIEESRPAGCDGPGITVLRDHAVAGVRQLVLRADDPIALQQVAAGTWQPVPLSLEDIFVALVNRQVDEPEQNATPESSTDAPVQGVSAE